MPAPRPLPHRHRITEALAALSLATVMLTVLAVGSSRATDAQSTRGIPASATPAAVGGGR